MKPVLRSLKQPIFPVSSLCGQWDSAGLCHSQRDTEAFVRGSFLSLDRELSDAREEMRSCVYSGWSLAWVHGRGKQTSEGQEGKEKAPRRETAVAAVALRTVTQQTVAWPCLSFADLLLNEENSGRSMYTFNQLRPCPSPKVPMAIFPTWGCTVPSSEGL